MLRIASTHVLRDVAPAAGPKARQVRRRLDWPACWRRDREDHRHLPAGQRRVGSKAEQRLRAHFDSWSRRRRVVDCVTAAGWADEVVWREVIEVTQRSVA